MFYLLLFPRGTICRDEKAASQVVSTLRFRLRDVLRSFTWWWALKLRWTSLGRSAVHSRPDKTAAGFAELRLFMTP